MEDPKDNLNIKPENTVSVGQLLLTPIALILESIFLLIFSTIVPILLIFPIKSTAGRMIVLTLYTLIALLLLIHIIRGSLKRKRIKTSNHPRLVSLSALRELEIMKDTSEGPLDGTSSTKTTYETHDKPLVIAIEEMKQKLPENIDISEVELVEEIIQDKDIISIADICKQSGLNEDKVLTITIRVLGMRRYYKDIITADYFKQMIRS
ncbi:MAG: hypothetical protein FK734_10030 [Asgard group archaeon]|nr:hypothetical protein [Asgard group archaeon]